MGPNCRFFYLGNQKKINGLYPRPKGRGFGRDWINLIDSLQLALIPKLLVQPIVFKVFIFKILTKTKHINLT